MYSVESNVAVSIYIITYKHAKYIRQCLDSIMNQKFSETFEVIVCDDCSNDGTEEILREYKNKYGDIFKYIVNQTNLGPSKNSYQGKLLSKGKYICPVEGDDWWCDEYRLQKQYDFLESHQNYSAVGCNYYSGTENNKIIYKKLIFNTQTNRTYFLKNYKKSGNKIHVNTLMYKNVLPYNEEKCRQLYCSENTMGDTITKILLYDCGPIYLLKDTMHVHRIGRQCSTSFSAQSSNKMIFYSYMFFRIIDNLTEYFDYKYDLKEMKVNRLSTVIFAYHFSKKRVKIDKEEYKNICKFVGNDILFKARIKSIKLLFIKLIRKVF